MNFANLLDGKKIVVGVSGSIAIYKTLELIRLFVKAGAKVRVVMSQEAKKFITPLTFEAISQNKVLHSDTESWADDNNHIGLSQWADIIVIAPASVNTINKISNGIADNLLLQTLIASTCIKILAPAANTNMINSPITEVSLKMLRLNRYKIVEPVSGELACMAVGKGKMSEPIEIFYSTVRELLKNDFFEYRGVVISGGATIEKIDDVRFISNFSSGKMAKALALGGYFLGADICYIGNDVTGLPQDLHTIKIQNTKEAKESIIQSIREAKKGVFKQNSLDKNDKSELIQKKPFFISAMAVSDYVPKYPQKGKIKKDLIGDAWNLELVKNIDILSFLKNDSDIFKVGFKAEFDKENAKENAKNMLIKKNLDAVCLNILGDEVSFGGEKTKIEMLFKDKEVALPFSDKLKTAFMIFKYLEN